MAIYHLEVQIISRSQGRSSVASSAYRACEKILDERTGMVHDFTKKKKDLLHKEILLPTHTPEWMKDRSKLWNHVEQIEKRKDAQLVREFNIALPKELSPEQNIQLAREFVQSTFVDKGMVADMCLHNGHKDGKEQPHAHVMVSLRVVTTEGFGPKNRGWNETNLLIEQRKNWADECNRHLALHGHDRRIDHRSNEELGINLEPQTKIGPKAARIHMPRVETHRQIAKENGERLLAKPILALDAIIRQQSTFTHQDLARFVNRHTDSQEQFTAVFEKVKSCPEITRLGLDKAGKERFTTQGMLDMESKMVNQAVEASQHINHAVDIRYQERISRRHTLNDSQAVAFKHVLNSGDTACVVGFAGTGKSYLLGAAKEAWEQAGYGVTGMSLTKKVADDLQMDSGIHSHTIANRIINWKHDREKLTSKDVVVIDEAGMVCSGQMAAIVQEVSDARAKLVLVGDWQQLQAIDAGAPFRAITERIGAKELNEILRQGEAWQKGATKNLAHGHVKEALQAYEQHDLIHGFETKREAIHCMLEQWQETRSNAPEQSQLLLAYTRADVKKLNDAARQMRKDNGELGAEHRVLTTKGNKDFAIEDKILFLRNEKSLDVSNGTLGTIKSIENNKLIVELGQRHNNRIFTFSTDFYKDITHGYASTIHKNQGTTVDRSYVLASRFFDQHVTNVALTRHKESCEVFWSRDEFANQNVLYEIFSREGAKDISVDYLHNQRTDFAEIYPHKSQEIIQDISQERLNDAEGRLMQRRLNKDVQMLETRLDKSVSFELQEGDKGIFRGTVKFGGEMYGLLEQNGQVKLLDDILSKGLFSGKTYEIKQSQTHGQEPRLEIKNNHEMEKTKDIERSIDFELSL